MSKITAVEKPAIQMVNEAYAEEQFRRAADFFPAEKVYSPLAVELASKPESYASDQGTVQFHLIGQEPPAGSPYSDIMNEDGDILMDLGGLVHGYMSTHYPSVNTVKLDIETWITVLNHIPMLVGGSVTSKSYRNAFAGTKISGQFLQMVADAIITDGASILVDFTSYLRAVGDVVFSVHTKSESYKTVSCTYQSYLLDNGAGGYFDYAAVVLRQIQFSEYFMELKSACSETKLVNVQMDYKEFKLLVPTRKFRTGGAYHSKWANLINPNATQQFKDAGNFFNASKTPQDQIDPKV